MATGDIAILDTLEWTISGDSQTAVEVRDGIIACFFNTTSNVPQCATFSYDSSGTLVKLDEETLTGVAVAAILTSSIKIADGIAAFTYISSTPYPYKGSVSTVSIDANGAITTAVVDTLEFESTSAYDAYIVHGTGDFWVIAYSNKVDDDSYIVTIDIDSSGAIAGAVTASQQVTSNFSNNVNVIQLADGTIAIFHNQSTTGTTVETRTISAGGAISATIDSSVWSANSLSDFRPFHVGGTIYACLYQDGSTLDGFIETFDITDSGTITSAGIDLLEYETTKVNGWPSGKSAGGISCIFHSDNNGAGQFQTIDIDSSGNIGAAVLATQELEATFADNPSIVKISAVLYIATWMDNDADGQAASLSVAIEKPTVTTASCKLVISTTATGQGSITDLGGANPTAHGHCWNTSPNPTTALSTKTDNGAKTSTGDFISLITDLTPGTGYYTRAYATNLGGTSYGENVYFVASLSLAGYTWWEGSNVRGFDETAIEQELLNKSDVDDTSVNTATDVPISSNWAYDHENDDSIHSSGLGSFFHHGYVDGTEIGAILDAMDHLDVDLDGGTF